MRGRPRQQCPRRGQPAQWRQVTRGEDPRRQSALLTECPEARAAGREVRRAAGRGPAEFAALETALIDELAPQGVLQSILVGRIARAAWRLDRADRLEAEVLEERRYGGAGPGLALIRDGNATRTFDTLLRYRGVALAELMRSLRTLKALQAQQAVPARPAALAEARAPGALRPAAVAPILAAEAVDRPAARIRSPNEPKGCGNPRKSAPPDDRPSGRNSGSAAVRPLPLPTPGRMPEVQRSLRS